LLVLRCRLRGLSVEQTKAAVRREYDDEPGAVLDSEVDGVLQAFQKSVPLRSLLHD